MITLNKMASLVSDSTIAITFYLPMELLDNEDQPMQEIANNGAEASGTPILSFYTVEEAIKLNQPLTWETLYNVYFSL